jgi:hypothetical protein
MIYPNNALRERLVKILHRLHRQGHDCYSPAVQLAHRLLWRATWGWPY